MAIVATTPAPTAAPTPTAVPTPSPTPDPEAVRKAAGAAYLAAVTPYNKRLDVLWKQYRYKTSLTANKAYCAELRDQRTYLRARVAEDDRAGGHDCRHEGFDSRRLGEEARLRACSKATSVAGWQRAWNLATKANDRGLEAANLVRLDLGLPSVSGN